MQLLIPSVFRLIDYKIQEKIVNEFQKIYGFYEIIIEINYEQEWSEFENDKMRCMKDFYTGISIFMQTIW